MCRCRIGKAMCLFNAVAWALIFGIHAFRIADGWEYYGRQARIISAAGLVILLLCDAVHWHRFLAYDKKINNVQEENNNE